MTDLDLENIFFEVKDQVYVVIRLPDPFPVYIKGSDIDIFCYDKDAFGKKILTVARDYVKKGYEIEVTELSDKLQTHIDFFREGKLEFRFDLYGRLPCYKKAKVKEHLFYSVIENARHVERYWKEEAYAFYVPAEVDDYLLRYLEYVEYYEQRPDKIKHLEFILKDVEEIPSRIGFLDKLHLYTDLPKCISHVSENMSQKDEALFHVESLVKIFLRRFLPLQVRKRINKVRKTIGKNN